ncbi:dehydrogenase/reductase SDR family member 7 isoform X1 [Coffea eugenioides]|uniref:dehydrogenase/reductase SDR family member 7 isoform X1 n=1 Tax=Coffea eugenioides TaxID=49369 RepID=UPI000F608DAC|nr:dehydrogenase/reductase SDR family member 7 isoform X1 [Coffea eugenioides]
MLILSIALLLIAAFIGVFYKFLTADGDFTLLSKGHVKRVEIEDKVIWITGASRGIGEILAKQLASLGAKLIISARNEAELECVKKQLAGKHAPDEVMILPLDLTSGEDKLREAVQQAESLFSGAGVDYLIHNAAFERPKTTALDVTEQSLKATFDVNVLGPISLTRLLAPYMLKRGRGHFVVMSSAAGKTPAPGQAVYSASKFAVNGYFHSLRSELYRKGIKVTVVCPGPIKTSSTPEASTSSTKLPAERRVSSERCAELTTIAASHGLKEAWISYQPVLAVMYLVQYVPTIGFWLMDKVGARRVEAAAKQGDTYSLALLFGKKKE